MSSWRNLVFLLAGACYLLVIDESLLVRGASTQPAETTTTSTVSLTPNQQKLLKLLEQKLDTELLRQLPRLDDGRRLVVVDYVSQPKRIEPSEEGEPVKQIDENRVVSAPIYSDIDLAFTRGRRDHDRIVMDKITRVVEQLTKGLMIDGQYAISAGIKFVSDVMSMGRDFKDELEKINMDDTSPPMKDGYSASMAGLIKSILDEPSTERLTAEEAFRRVLDILAAMRELGEHSLAGLYLDWTEMTLDGRKLAVASAPVIQWFRNKGMIYRSFLNSVRKLSGWFGSLKPTKKSKPMNKEEKETDYSDEDREIVKQYLFPSQLKCRLASEMDFPKVIEQIDDQ